MAKTLIRTQFRGDLAGGVTSNVQIIETFEFVDDDTGEAIAVKDITRSATAEELQAIVTPAVATLSAANATLTEQNTALQTQNDNLSARINAATQALALVAQADANWDNGVRTAVAAVLQVEAE